MAGYGGIWSDMERYIKTPQKNRPHQGYRAPIDVDRFVMGMGAWAAGREGGTADRAGGRAGARAGAGREGLSVRAHTTRLGVDPSTTRCTPLDTLPLHWARSTFQTACTPLVTVSASRLLSGSLFQSRRCAGVLPFGPSSLSSSFPSSSSPPEGHCCSPRRLPPSRSAPRRRTPPLSRAAQGPSRFLGHCCSPRRVLNGAPLFTASQEKCDLGPSRKSQTVQLLGS